MTLLDRQNGMKTQDAPESANAEAAKPAVTAMICTRNRGASIVAALESLLANTHPDFELIVVDQSTNDETAEAVRPFLGDARLRYLRSETSGLGRARNVGIAQARGEVIIMTDDDCEVESNWLEAIAAAFARHPKAAVVYCNVVPGPYDPEKGFIPAYAAPESRLMTSMRDWCAPHGIGAGMAVRRNVMEEIGGFDETFGAGGAFFSFEDSDVALRVLARGYHVYHTHETTVTHFGFRTWEEGRTLSQRDCFGIGAGYAKLLKCGMWRASLPWTYEVTTLVLLPLFQSLIRFKKPPVLVRGVSLGRGFWQGLRAPVDRAHVLYRLPGGS